MKASPVPVLSATVTGKAGSSALNLAFAHPQPLPLRQGGAQPHRIDAAKQPFGRRAGTLDQRGMFQQRPHGTSVAALTPQRTRRAGSRPQAATAPAQPCGASGPPTAERGLEAPGCAQIGLERSDGLANEATEEHHRGPRRSTRALPWQCICDGQLGQRSEAQRGRPSDPDSTAFALQPLRQSTRMPAEKLTRCCEHAFRMENTLAPGRLRLRPSRCRHLPTLTLMLKNQSRTRKIAPFN